MKPEMTIPEKEANLKKDKKKSDQSKAADKINLSPKLQEASGRTAVLVWGRMNPPTIGHEKLVKKQLKVARSMGATPILLLSHSEDAEKNPLPYDDKLFLAKKAFGNHVQKSPARTVIEAIQHVDKNFDNIVLLCGSDRVKDYKRVMGYNGKDFNFDSTKVMSAGQRDPDAEGAEGMSASKMRKAVEDGDERAFKSGLPSRLKMIADQIFEMVKNGMKLAEMYMEEELVEVLSIQQRRKRAIQMRRYKTRIARARKIARKRMATKDKLVRRAQKAARQLVRKRVAGERGTRYANLTVADKMNIDRRVEQRKSLIQKLAKRLMPAIRKAEMVRLKKARGYSVSEELDRLFEEYMTNVLFEQTAAQDPDIKDRKGTQPARYHKGLKPSTKAARDAHFKKHGKKADDDPTAYKPAPGDASAKTKPSKYTKQYHDMYGEDVAGTKEKHAREKERMKARHDREMDRAKIADIKREEFVIDMQEEDIFKLVDYMMDKLEENTLDYLDEKSGSALADKSKKSGISVGTLRKVYNRGVAAWKTGHRPGTTPQQWGFARVNAFIAKKKKGNLNHDTDLAHTELDKRFDTFMQEAVEIGKDAAQKYAKDTPNQKVPVVVAVDGVPQPGGMIKKPNIDVNEMFEGAMSRAQQAAIAIAKKKSGKYKENASENFMDGKNPEDKGDMARHGLKGKSISDLKKVRSSDSASPRKKQLAHWYINMQKGKKK